MATVTTPLAEEAKSIFTDLGYSVSSEGTELRAERKWRVVHVTPIEDPSEVPSDGRLRCFVTRPDRAPDLRDALSGSDLAYEWAVMGVDDSGDYEVYHDPTASS